MKEEVYKKKMEGSKLPSNCPFLIPKRTNTEIWSNLSTFTRSTDVKIQEILSLHSSSVTVLLRAASDLSESKSFSTKEPMLALKEDVSLVGTVLQSINTLRRDLMKPALPKGYSNLASEASESSELLFGGSICEILEQLKKENKLKEILSNKDKRPKRKFETSSNPLPSYKSLRRVEYRNQGQRDYINSNNNRSFNNNRNLTTKTSTTTTSKFRSLSKRRVHHTRKNPKFEWGDSPGKGYFEFKKFPK